MRGNTTWAPERFQKWYGPNERRRREDRGALGAEGGKVWGGSAPLSSRLKGLVE